MNNKHASQLCWTNFGLNDFAIDKASFMSNQLTSLIKVGVRTLYDNSVIWGTGLRNP